MRILRQDPKTGEITVLVTNSDDLWHLYNIIRTGDVVKGHTYRREEAREDAIRAQRESKVRIYLTVRVEKVEFTEFSSMLRVTGTIEEAEFGSGLHHTFNVEEGTEITIVKEEWPAASLERLREAASGKGAARFICISIEHGEATVAVIKSFGVDEVATIHGRKSKDEAASRDRDETSASIIRLVKSLPRMPILVVGPGFMKDDFLREARAAEPSLFSNAQLIQTGQAGMAGIREAVSKPENAKLFQEARIAEEARVVEEIKKLIATDGLVTFGIEQIVEALDAGAVSRLVVTDRLLRESATERLMKKAEEKAGVVMVVTSRWEPGRQIDALGGAAAILRYKR
ncbi:MAG: mRNA surveillance protein pelota [Thermoplasmata archaeon]|nr:mRNA surveillance protein pelota [Candidatus Sysuiplasma acidicola]